MLQQKLTNLRDFILKFNPYFTKGYDNAVMDNLEGQINDGDEVIFPADDKGSYFYLRLPNNLVPDYSNIFDIGDSRQGIGIKYDVILVAMVEDGDNGLLLENMITTIGKYVNSRDCDDQIKITKMIYQADVILMQELAKIGKDNIGAALENFPANTGICCVHFSFTIPFIFQNLNCLQKPCKPCSPNP